MKKKKVKILKDGGNREWKARVREAHTYLSPQININKHRLSGHHIYSIG